MNNQLIIEWLHRILSEKCSDTKNIQERISILNHQIEHFEGMSEVYQIQVLEDAIKDVEFYREHTNINWSTALAQLKLAKEARE